MHSEFIPLPLGALFDFSIQPHMIAIIVPIAGLIFGGAIAISAMYFQHRRRESWHETARIALEKGQPLPPLNPEEIAEDREPRRRPDLSNDIRGGMVLIGVGAGLWLMLGGIAANLRYIGAIPGFIGVALLLYALLVGVFGRKNPPQDPSSRS